MEIKSLKGIGNNKQCIIVGAGPSAHYLNTNNIKKSIVITVNSSILKVPNCNYYVADDWAVSTWDYFYKPLKESSCKKLFYEKKLKLYANHINKDDIFWFSHREWIVNGKKDNSSLIISDDPNVPIIGARTCVASAINFAYIMGCNPIILIGCDCCLKDNKRYYWQYENEIKPKKIDNTSISFFSNRAKYNGNFMDNHSYDFLEYWNDFSKINPHLNIIDCSDGVLNCFKKGKIEEFYDK